MRVKNIIKNKIYIDLIEYAFKKSDAIMFIIRKDMYINNFRRDEKKLKKLEQLEMSINNKFNNEIIKRRNGSYWVYTKVGYSWQKNTSFKDPKGFKNLFAIYFIKLSNKAKEYLLTNRDLYNWLHTEYPEDISFFKDGYCWLYSVAHEQLCEIYCENKEEYEYLKSIGIEFYDKEFKPISKEELYFEEY